MLRSKSEPNKWTKCVHVCRTQKTLLKKLSQKAIEKHYKSAWAHWRPTTVGSPTSQEILRGWELNEYGFGIALYPAGTIIVREGHL